ncbi:SRPBCC domain-containing protein [Actinotalea soli]|nr:SRPBCC domain-containing protein [Actinotalea soli]
MRLPEIVGRADAVGGEVRMRVTLPAPVEQAWLALTDSQRTVSWLGRLDTVAIAEGGRFDLWHDKTVRSRHTVTKWHSGHLLSLTWDFPEERTSRVTFTLAEESPSTSRLTLHHEDLEDAVSYAAGWHRHLQYLHGHLRGDDLPIDDFWSGYDDLVELYASSAPTSEP